MSQQNFMDESFFVFEVMIELTLAGSGSLNDFVRAGQMHTLLVKEVGGGRNYPAFCLDTRGVMFLHACLQLVRIGQYLGGSGQKSRAGNNGESCTSFKCCFSFIRTSPLIKEKQHLKLVQDSPLFPARLF